MLPLLYLHGLSSGDFVPALAQFLAHAGLSASTARNSSTGLAEQSMDPETSQGRRGPDRREEPLHPDPCGEPGWPAGPVTSWSPRATSRPPPALGPARSPEAEGGRAPKPAPFPRAGQRPATTVMDLRPLGIQAWLPPVWFT